jgi:hypothetical protein
LIFPVVSFLLLFAGYEYGRSIDCAPGQQDGQCALGTFLGLFNGLIAGGVLFILGWAATIADWYWTKRRNGRASI